VWRQTPLAGGGGRWSLPRWAPIARDVDELYLYLFWDDKAKRNVCSTLRVRRQPRCSWWWCGSIMGPLMGGMWVWGVVGVTQCCHRQLWQCEGRDSPPVWSSPAGPPSAALLRQRQHVRPAAAVARAPFSASFPCCSLTSIPG
jgi:hypothetical protein